MEILEATYVISSPDVKQCPPADKIEFAFIGRSNVGKSSLINMLCRKQHLAKTSAEPGKTQMINHFIITSRTSPTAKKRSQWYLVDLPGYGYAKTSQQNRRAWENMIAGYLQQRESLATVMVLIDGRHEPQKIDLEFLDQLGEWQVPFAVVFTKADKMKPGGLQRNMNLFRDKMRENWEVLPPFFASSATDTTGRDEILTYLSEIIIKENEAA